MLWVFYPGNVFFAAELLLGELIFLYPVPKRKVFPARLIAALTIVMVLAGFIPRITDDQLRIVSDLMRFVGIFVGSVVMFGTCFRIKTSMLVSMCVAGYAVQHLAYNTAWLLRQLPTVAGDGAIAIDAMLRTEEKTFCQLVCETGIDKTQFPLNWYKVARNHTPLFCFLFVPKNAITEPETTSTT